MPLAQPIASLRLELQKLLANDELPAALKLCKELLPEGSEKFDLILSMQVQIQQLNKDNLKGKISQEEYARRLANIVDAFIQFVRELEEADFETTESETSELKADVQTGNVLYRVPLNMSLGKANICIIRVAIDEDAIFEDIIIDYDVRLREKVEVSERMSAELVDTSGEVFDILPLNSKDQRVKPTSYTQWLFRVTPQIEGDHQLLVKVSLLEFDQNTREYVPRDVSVLETVKVVTGAQPNDEENEAPFKSTGDSLILGVNAANSKLNNSEVGDINIKKTLLENKGFRIIALFLAFLVFASGTTFAFTPRITRDWWIASWKDTAEAYQSFIDAHKKTAKEGIYNNLIEKAYYKKAIQSNDLKDFRNYENIYNKGGAFIDDVQQSIRSLELNSINHILENPTVSKILQHLKEFPDAQYLSQIKEAVKKLSKSEQETLFHKIEQRLIQLMLKEEYSKFLDGNVQNDLKDAMKPQVSKNKNDTKQKTVEADINKSKRDTKKIEKAISDLLEEVITTSRNLKLDPFRSDMVFIKGGEFLMGSSDTDSDGLDYERPPHLVKLTDFKLCRYEVTQAQWKEVMGTVPSSTKFGNCEKCPVEGISWNEIEEFLHRLSKLTGKAYRLPTEAEWEYAARGGNKSKGFKYSGSNSLTEIAWFEGNCGTKTNPVGLKQSNELGLFDMSGNVSEWCQDWKGEYSTDMQYNPKGPSTGRHRIYRGGSWFSNAQLCRILGRFGYSPSVRNDGLGFRIAL